MVQEPVVIIGAGPAGLAAAHELVKRGIRPLVLEKADKVGGLARTETYKGYCFDIGGHRFFTRLDKVQRLWEEMLPNDFIKVPRLSRINFNGRLFNYPLDFFNTFTNLGFIESFLILLSYFRAQVRPYPEERSFEQWVTNRFGSRLHKRFFQAYTEKVWGIPCHRIQADWAAQRIKKLSLIAALSNALFGTQRPRTLIDEFWYPKKGSGMMWQRFQEVIQAGGGQIRLNSKAVALKHESGLITSVIGTNGSKHVEMPVGHVISSIPVSELLGLIDPAIPDEVLEAGSKLTYRAFIIVGLIINKRDLFPDQWIYVHSPDVRVGRIQNFKNWSEDMVPDPEKTSIGMEYFCSRGDKTWTMSDFQLLELASQELTELGLADTGDIKDGIVLRQPKAYPIYDQGYNEQLEVIQAFLKTIKNLQTIGRNGMHRYNNMDHSMLTGMLAVENIFGKNHDLWDVTDEHGYLEEDKKTRAEKHITEKILTKTFARIDKLAFAIAAGSVSGLLFFMATIWLVIKGGEVVGPNLRLLSQYFIGYTVTAKGAFIASVYGFLWGFLFGWLFAYLRNLFLAFFIYRTKKKAELLSLKDFFDHL